MRDIVVFNSLTLDGVMQAPGLPDEDPRGGFTQGGWAAPYMDETMTNMAGESDSDLLLGRITYENLYGYWPKQTDDNPFTEILNRTQKHVASRTMSEPLPWKNSTLLKGDAAETVGTLKAGEGNDLVVLGSGELVRTLMRHNLVDRYVLLIHPLVLGSGRRMFAGANHAKLHLVETVTTTTGVIIATYSHGR
jgi:dihydrofolate reductase